MKKTKTILGFPRQIANIIGNEACERFSYYGMRAILVVYMMKFLSMEESMAKSTYHYFISANYFLPLVGAFLADRYWGKYKTILYLSIVYCAGHAALAAFEGTHWGLYLGLGLIAFGSGGIKPCVTTFVGDQFNESNKHLIPKVYDLFYYSINFGAFFSILLIPWVLARSGPSLAFAIPGILMGVATIVFYMGRKHYVNVPPIAAHSKAMQRTPKQKAEERKAMWGVFTIFLPIPAFWALWDQQGSSWVIQAGKMDLNFFGWRLEPSQVQSFNAIFVLIAIPIFSLWVYPMVGRLGVKVTALRKMGTGMFVTGISFVVVAACQLLIDQGAVVNVGWQVFALLLLSIGEIMVSISGLEFAYTQAPKSLKSTIMSFYLLAVSAGNLLTAVISQVNPFSTATAEFLFYAGLVSVVGVVFVVIASRYKERTFVG